MRETQVQFLGQEDPLEKGMATHASILAWRIPWTKEWATVHGVTKIQIPLSDQHFESSSDIKSPLGDFFFFFFLANCNESFNN